MNLKCVRFLQKWSSSEEDEEDLWCQVTFPNHIEGSLHLNPKDLRIITQKMSTCGLDEFWFECLFVPSDPSLPTTIVDVLYQWIDGMKNWFEIDFKIIMDIESDKNVKLSEVLDKRLKQKE